MGTSMEAKVCGVSCLGDALSDQLHSRPFRMVILKGIMCSICDNLNISLGCKAGSVFGFMSKSTAGGCRPSNTIGQVRGTFFLLC